MRVAYISSAYPPVPGGTQVHVQQVARAVAAAGQCVVVATRFIRGPADVRRGHCGWDDSGDRQDGAVPVRVVTPERVMRPLLKVVHRLHYHGRTQGLAISLHRAAIRRPLDVAVGRADVLHYCGTGRELLGFSALAVARRRGIPLVVTSFPHFGMWGDSELDLWLYRRADRIIALTQWERRQWIDRGLDPDRVAVAPCVVEVTGTGQRQAFRNRFGIPSSTPLVLFLGQRTSYKGYGRLLAALPEVWKRQPNIHAALVGPAGADAVEVEARHAATLADGRVHSLGPVDEACKQDALAGCELFCLPSEAESFGIAPVEAALYGKRAVVGDLPAVREVLAGCGAEFVGTSPQGVAAAILKLAGELGEPMPPVPELDRYAAPAVAATLAELYRAAIASTGPVKRAPCSAS